MEEIKERHEMFSTVCSLIFIELQQHYQWESTCYISFWSLRGANSKHIDWRNLWFDRIYDFSNSSPENWKSENRNIFLFRSNPFKQSLSFAFSALAFYVCLLGLAGHNFLINFYSPWNIFKLQFECWKFKFAHLRL